MFCSKCGAKVDENQKFCAKCGAAIELPTGSGISQINNQETFSQQVNNGGSSHENPYKKVISEFADNPTAALLTIDTKINIVAVIASIVAFIGIFFPYATLSLKISKNSLMESLAGDSIKSQSVSGNFLKSAFGILFLIFIIICILSACLKFSNVYMVSSIMSALMFVLSFFVHVGNPAKILGVEAEALNEYLGSGLDSISSSLGAKIGNHFSFGFYLMLLAIVAMILSPVIQKYLESKKIVK